MPQSRHETVQPAFPNVDPIDVLIHQQFSECVLQFRSCGCMFLQSTRNEEFVDEYRAYLVVDTNTSNSFLIINLGVYLSHGAQSIMVANKADALAMGKNIVKRIGNLKISFHAELSKYASKRDIPGQIDRAIHFHNRKNANEAISLMNEDTEDGSDADELGDQQIIRLQ